MYIYINVYINIYIYIYIYIYIISTVIVTPDKIADSVRSQFYCVRGTNKLLWCLVYHDMLVQIYSNFVEFA